MSQRQISLSSFNWDGSVVAGVGDVQVKPFITPTIIINPVELINSLNAGNMFPMLHYGNGWAEFKEIVPLIIIHSVIWYGPRITFTPNLHNSFRFASFDEASNNAEH